MDYFQGVVTDYLRADRAMFVNAECFIHLDSDKPEAKGRNWYCDALAVKLGAQPAAYLCEISYSKTLAALMKRLEAWATHWEGVRTALHRDSCIPREWHVQPWLFVQADGQRILEAKLPTVVGGSGMPMPRITHLEDVMPWKYSSWDRREEALVKCAAAERAQTEAEEAASG